MANCFYLLITALQMIPLISITNGQPVMLYPLSIVIGVSMIKDIYEDWKRHKSDRVENQRKVILIEAASSREVPWQELTVGSVVKVRSGEFFPADLLLIASSEPQGACFVETKNLDGETSLKAKRAPKAMLGEEIGALSGTINCEMPND